MAVYPSAKRFMVYLVDTWTDLSDYWIEDVTGHWGIPNNGPVDFIAETGVLNFVLNNSGQLFTPGHASALTGWKKGIPAKLEIDYRGDIYPFYGSIGKIEIPLHEDKIDLAYVSLVDWIEYSAETPIATPTVGIDQRGNEMMDILIGLAPVGPLHTEFSEGVSIFSSTFDTITDETRILREMEKIALSELSYIYLKKDQVFGETLVFESAHDRQGWRALDQYPIATDDSFSLLLETGDHLLLETGDYLLLNELEAALSVDNDMLDLEVDYSETILNYSTSIAQPRRIDTSVKTLFQLDEPISIPSGQTITIRGSYSDPTSGSAVNAYGMFEPVATTDYLVNTRSNGTGTNLTGSLTLVDTPYYADGFVHLVRNDNAKNGWITKYNARGYGIYLYNPISWIYKDDNSINAYGYKELQFEQVYQVNIAPGALHSVIMVEREREPYPNLRKLTMLANQSHALMMSFLNLGPGSLVEVINDQRAIDNYFYIQGVTDFSLGVGGLLKFSWIVRRALSLLSGLSELAIEFGGDGTGDAIDFGHIYYIANREEQERSERTIAAWIYLNDFAPSGAIAGFWGGDAAFLLHTDDVNESVLFTVGYASDTQEWTSPASSLATGAWKHIVVTKDGNSGDAPVIYINGSSVTVTLNSTVISPAEDPEYENGVHFSIGNIETSADTWGAPLDGKIKDARVYTRILTSSEVTTLYNSGSQDPALVTDGLKFQAFCVKSTDYDDYEDTTLTEDMHLLENIFNAVGFPVGDPIGRAP